MLDREENIRKLYTPRVLLGARWLDNELPGWEKNIKTSLLDLSESRCCILGQAFDREYILVLRDKTVNLRESDAEKWSERHGFTVRSDSLEEFSMLTEAWRRYLYIRQNETK